MAALCGVVKVILSFSRHGEEGAGERHRTKKSFISNLR